MNGEFLIPFETRSEISHITKGFLWRYENIYLMDDHRYSFLPAIFHLRAEPLINVYHLDRHYDTKVVVEHDISLLQEFVSSHVTNDDWMPPQYITWENYLSFFLVLFRRKLRAIKMCTQHVGDLPAVPIQEIEAYKLLDELQFDFSRHCYRFWVNLDLDFFFAGCHPPCRWIADDLIEKLADIFKQGLEDGTISLLTVAISPECCGGWEPAEKSLKILFDKLCISSPLPQVPLCRR
jgi:hypothetical protein